MTGDGVNDALALKDADIGVAMGSGSDATRAVAQLVLLDSTFDSLPPVVAEGRRVLGNIERTSGLYLNKTVYAMLILGGVGSQTGAVLGAVVVYVFLEALRDPDVSGWVFYVTILLALLLVVRPRWMVAGVLAATVAFGFVVHAIAGAIDETWTTAAGPDADSVTRFLDAWVVIPATPGDARAIAYIGLIALVLFCTTVKGVWRWLALVPTLYLAAFVWENIMSADPDVTRFVLLGALLVSVMVIRPSGILGERRVEIV